MIINFGYVSDLYRKIDVTMFHSQVCLSRWLPPYAKSVAQLMAQIALLPPRHRSSRIAYNMYVNDEVAYY